MLQVITDLVMVGRISAFAVAAVGLGLQSLMFVFAVLTVLHVGTSALLSRFVGAGQMYRASAGIPLAFNFVLSGALRGAGDSKKTLKINLISLWLVRIIPAFLLSWYFENILFVYLAMISDTFVKAFWLWRIFQKGEWQKIKV